MTPHLTVSSLSVMENSVWTFRNGGPQWHPKFSFTWTNFDPFPAYPHSFVVVEEAARYIERRCLPIWNVDLYVADREEVSRSNGHSEVHEGGHYEGSEWVKDEPEGLILLSGKRIPPHPAMTHYLVTHEYGHHIHFMLNHLRGKHAQDDEPLREYLKVRGLPVEQHMHHGEGGTWHNSGHEILACDFRIVVGKVETDFWPHPGIPYPDSPALDEWWQAAVFDLGVARTERMVDNP